MRNAGVSRAVLLVVLLGIAGFVYGFLSAEARIPPYEPAYGDVFYSSNSSPIINHSLSYYLDSLRIASSYTDSELSGTYNNTVLNGSLRLKKKIGFNVSYVDDFSTNKHIQDSYSNESVGYSPGYIFRSLGMTSEVGNITYRYNNSLGIYSATAYITTQESSGGNASIDYRLENGNWTNINWTTSLYTKVGGTIYLNNVTEFYIRIASVWAPECRIDQYEINYTVLDYQSEGTFISEIFDLGNVLSYDTISWNFSLQSSTNLTLQTRSGTTATYNSN
ncbi:MAG: hypothetical protein ABIJ00_01510, partial [Candidatus Eisenbacteria bacterium]